MINGRVRLSSFPHLPHGGDGLLVGIGRLQESAVVPDHLFPFGGIDQTKNQQRTLRWIIVPDRWSLNRRQTTLGQTVKASIRTARVRHPVGRAVHPDIVAYTRTTIIEKQEKRVDTCVRKGGGVKIGI